MSGLCKYANAFGAAGTGAHALRDPIFGLAVVDIAATVVLALIVWQFVLKRRHNFFLVFFGLWAVGVALHLLFCVHTPITDIIDGTAGARTMEYLAHVNRFGPGPVYASTLD